jgi:1-acyl-sn-glycerol-3-phosphate acyltransferase
MAIEHNAVLVPVAVHSSAACLPPHSALGVRPGTVTVELLDPIPTRSLTLADRHRLCEQAEGRIRAALQTADGGTARPPDPVRSRPARG